MARQAWQPRRGTWRPYARDGTVLWHPPGRPGQGIMTDLIFAPWQRIRCGWALASQGSGAHTGDQVVLLQTPAAAKTADTGVKLSAEASREVTGIRTGIHSRGVCVRCGRNAPGATAPRAYERHREVTTEADLARIQIERETSQRGPERINRQELINKPRRRRIRRSASPLSRGVTTPDLPEGI